MNQQLKLIEAKITLEPEKGFRKNIILSTYRFLHQHKAQTAEIPQTMSVDKQLFLAHHNHPIKWNLEYSIDANDVCITLSEKYFDIGAAIEEKEDWQSNEQENDEPRQTVSLDHAMNPLVIWRFPTLSVDYVRAYWIKKDHPTHSLIFIVFTENMNEYSNEYSKIEWLTDALCKHYRTESKKASGTISLDGKLRRTF